MKLCLRCNVKKPFSDFRKMTKSKDGFQRWCRVCFAEYEHVRYQNGDNVRKKANDASRIGKNKKYIKEYLQNHPCIECGDSDWWALDFDHLDRNTKHKEISIMIYNNGLDRIKQEIDKCQILCVKCHRKKTINQLGWWRVIETE